MNEVLFLEQKVFDDDLGTVSFADAMIYSNGLRRRIMSYRRTITGFTNDGFTAAEIEDGTGTYLGRIFELEDGWYVHVNDPQQLRNSDFIEAIIDAKSELSHYVNRKGPDFSEGEWTKAGISLWLMQRDDGKGFTIDPKSEA